MRQLLSDAHCHVLPSFRAVFSALAVAAPENLKRLPRRHCRLDVIRDENIVVVWHVLNRAASRHRSSLWLLLGSANAVTAL